jgi:hypothetical protein
MIASIGCPIFLAFACIPGAALAQAQAYPTKPVR